MKENTLTCKIDPTSTIINSYVGDNVKVWKNVSVRESRLCSNVSIGDFSIIERSILKDYVNIQRNNLIYSTQIGRYTYTGKNLTCWNSKIGSFCSISWNVSIGGANHDYERVTTSAFLYSDIFDIKGGNKGYDRFYNDCEIGNDVWIGCGAIVCRGVKIGHGAVIGANAVVTKDVEPYSIVAGVPAKHIKYRFTPDIIHRLLEIKWWNFPKDVIRENYLLFNTHPRESLERLIEIRKELDGRMGETE